MADSGNATKYFSNKTISVKLDESNFAQWKQQVDFMIIQHDLESFIDGTPPPPEFITSSDGSRSRNPVFAEYRKVDAALASWLFSSISQSILPSLTNCRSARSIWQTLQPASSTTRVMRLLTTLHSQKKGNSSMREYIDRIQMLCDSLASADAEHKVSELVQICLILGGLGSEYESTISVITGSRVPFDLPATVNLLLDAEVRLQDVIQPLSLNSTALSVSVGSRHQSSGSNSGGSSSVNSSYIDTGTSARRSFYPDQNRHPPPPSTYNNSSQYAQPRHQQYGGSGQSQMAGRGRGYSSNRIQCQLCGRYGHLSANCWFRDDPNFPGIGARRGNTGLLGSAPIGANSVEYYSTEESYCEPPSDFYNPSVAHHQVHYNSHPQPASSPHHLVPASHNPGSSVQHIRQVMNPRTHPHHYTASSAPSQVYHASASRPDAWYPDSGATNHLTNTIDNMTQSSSYNGSGSKNGGGTSGGN